VGFAEGFAPLYVAVPGGPLKVSESGSGTILQFMKAVAAMYGVPVVLQGIGDENEVEWALDSPDAMAAVGDELKELGLKAEVRESGLLWIGTN
jgi:hypothetical protein